MKFQPRRFVVEVKRGTSRAAFASPDTVSDKFSSAEEMLFGVGTKPVTVKAEHLPAASAGPARRILESLIEPPPTVVEDLPERPRRGRKPGSKNKPKLRPVEVNTPVIPAPTADMILVPKRADRSTVAGRRGFVEDRPSWRDHVVPAPLHPEAPRAAEVSTRDEDTETPAGAQRGRIRLRERSSIIKRYVLGTEPMPGQTGSFRARRAARAR